MKLADPHRELAQGYRFCDLGVSLRKHSPDTHDGAAAMLLILAARWDGGRVRSGEVAAATGLGPERPAGHALNLEDDGCLIFEREETLHLTSFGRTVLEKPGCGGLHSLGTLDEHP